MTTRRINIRQSVKIDYWLTYCDDDLKEIIKEDGCPANELLLYVVNDADPKSKYLSSAIALAALMTKRFVSAGIDVSDVYKPSLDEMDVVLGEDKYLNGDIAERLIELIIKKSK